MLPKCGISKMPVLSVTYHRSFLASGKITKAPNRRRDADQQLSASSTGGAAAGTVLSLGRGQFLILSF
jgi:hypothetical protein